MKYNDEVEDLNDIGNMVSFLLSYTRHKNFLWDFFDMVLGNDAYDGLKEVVQHWKDEQEERGKEEGEILQGDNF